MLKFVLDVGVGNKTLQILRNNGYDVVSILEIEPSMDDSEILLIAENEGRMVVTMDKDFGELVYKSGQKHNGVLILRLEDATGDEKAAIMEKILLSFAVQIEGKFCVFQNGRLRVR